MSIDQQEKGSPSGDAIGPPATAGPPDAEVVRRVLDGHRDDYEVLVRRYQERFHRFAFGMVDDPNAAADLVQDSFVKAYTSLEGCQDPSQFESWVYQILRNRCRDFLKNVRRGNEALDDHPQLVSPIAGPGAELERSELRRTLRTAMATLPSDHREAFLLKHLQGHSYREISERQDASLSAVKMRVHRSREMLRSRIARDDGDDGDVTFGGAESSSEVEASATIDHSTATDHSTRKEP